MKRFWLRSISISFFVFFMLWVANKVTDLKMFTAFDTIGAAMKDFQLTDYAFSKLRPDPTVDERIILVNFGNIPRRDLARQIMMLSQFKPKVIGIDGFYNCEGGLRDTVNCPQLLDTLGNLMLSSAVQEAGNVVLATKLLQSDSLSRFDIDVYDSIEYADALFMDYAKPGFVSLPTDASYQEDVKLCRSLYPKVNVNGKDELAFAVQIAMIYDSVKTKEFLARGKMEELINFRGNIEVQRFRFMTEKTRDENNITASSNFKTMFYVIDAEELLRGDFLPEVIKGNVVMIGFLGEYLGDPSWEDKFFTPLNSKVAGRANPDMFGLVVHANAVAMILNEDYINELAVWGQYLVAFLVCLLTVALFIVMDRALPTWFDALSVLVQLLELLLISVFMIQAFTWWDLKLDLTVAIGVSALVGPCYDIFKSLQNEVTKRLTKRKQSVLNTVNQ